MLKRGRELCGFTFTHTKSKGDPWHDLILWPQNKAGTLVFGRFSRELALEHKKTPRDGNDRAVFLLMFGYWLFSGDQFPGNQPRTNR